VSLKLLSIPCQLTPSINAAEREKKDKMVEIIIAADASFVSLPSWDERMYIAVDVGRAKNIMPTPNGTPGSQSVTAYICKLFIKKIAHRTDKAFKLKVGAANHAA
jgi:hypothetical protein